MNKGNLKKMADYIKTIPQEKFAMNQFRDDEDTFSYECKTVGCVIGHCTILDESKLPRRMDGISIDFNKWSETFTGLSFYAREWDWCFNGHWHHVDNTPLGASKRIEYLLDGNELPENWKEQILGDAELTY